MPQLLKSPHMNDIIDILAEPRFLFKAGTVLMYVPGWRHWQESRGLSLLQRWLRLTLSGLKYQPSALLRFFHHGVEAIPFHEGNHRIGL